MNQSIKETTSQLITHISGMQWDSTLIGRIKSRLKDNDGRLVLPLEEEQMRFILKEAGLEVLEVIYDKQRMFPTIVAQKPKSAME